MFLTVFLISFLVFPTSDTVFNSNILSFLSVVFSLSFLMPCDFSIAGLTYFVEQ